MPWDPLLEALEGLEALLRKILELGEGALAQWRPGNPDPWSEGGSQAVLTGLAWAQYMIGMNQAFGVLGVMESPEFRSEMRRAKGVIMRRLEKLSYTEFRASWATARQLISLQGRLFMEQCFWELGEPWKNLITGFKPIDNDAPAGTAAATGTVASSAVGVSSATNVRLNNKTSGGYRSSSTTVRRV